ncbi:MAG: GGDEF domain-containing protein [bacterium]|nr:GGDEF domain-containing protein [bacterium]
MDENAPNRQLALVEEQLRVTRDQIVRMQQDIEVMEKEAIHDRFTRLYSQAYFQTRLNEEIVRSERYRHFLSLILIHVDFTSHHSTQQYQRELKQIGDDLMAGLTRRTDIVAVYGKRQIVIMLPETDPVGARTLVERYRATFPTNGRRLSYSVLSYPNDASNIEMVVARMRDLSEDLFRGTTRHSSRTDLNLS